MEVGGDPLKGEGVITSRLEFAQSIEVKPNKMTSRFARGWWGGSNGIRVKCVEKTQEKERRLSGRKISDFQQRRGEITLAFPQGQDKKKKRKKLHKNLEFKKPLKPDTNTTTGTCSPEKSSRHCRKAQG